MNIDLKWFYDFSVAQKTVFIACVSAIMVATAAIIITICYTYKQNKKLEENLRKNEQLRSEKKKKEQNEQNQFQQQQMEANIKKIRQQNSNLINNQNRIIRENMNTIGNNINQMTKQMSKIAYTNSANNDKMTKSINNLAESIKKTQNNNNQQDNVNDTKRKNELPGEDEEYKNKQLDIDIAANEQMCKVLKQQVYDILAAQVLEKINNNESIDIKQLVSEALAGDQFTTEEKISTEKRLLIFFLEKCNEYIMNNQSNIKKQIYAKYYLIKNKQAIDLDNLGDDVEDCVFDDTGEVSEKEQDFQNQAKLSVRVYQNIYDNVYERIQDIDRKKARQNLIDCFVDNELWPRKNMVDEVLKKCINLKSINNGKPNFINNGKSLFI